MRWLRAEYALRYIYSGIASALNNLEEWAGFRPAFLFRLSTHRPSRGGGRVPAAAGSPILTVPPQRGLSFRQF